MGSEWLLTRLVSLTCWPALLTPRGVARLSGGEEAVTHLGVAPSDAAGRDETAACYVPAGLTVSGRCHFLKNV